MMRIVSGKYRHRIIEWPNDSTYIRPTKDRIREALFSAIGDINNLKALDLYAGSGALGIEALSRGATFCYFVDISKIALSTIKNNLNNLNVPQTDYEIIPYKDIDAISKINEKIDLVFLDPPYKEGKYNEIIRMLNDAVLNENCIIVCESDHSLDLTEFNFNKIKEYKYGKIFITILWR